MAKLCVYSAIFGNYDALQLPAESWTADDHTRPEGPGVRFVCFTDRPMPPSPPWEIVIQEPMARTPALASRKRKALPHRFLPGESLTLWIDGYMRLIENPLDYVAEWLGDAGQADVALFPHPWRDTIEKEAYTCIQRDLANPMKLLIQLETYRQAGYDPGQPPLYETGFLLRRDSDKVRLFGEMWWQHLDEFTHRDQISFPFCAYKTGLAIRPIAGEMRASNFLDMSAISNRHK